MSTFQWNSFFFKDTLIQIIQTNEKSGKRSISICDPSGKMILQSAYDKSRKEVFKNQYGQLFYRQTFDVKGYRMENTWIYKDELKTFHLLIPDLTGQIDTNTFIFRLDWKKRGYFSDINGQCIGDIEYDEIERLYLGFYELIQLKKEGLYSLITNQLNPVCDSCCCMSQFPDDCYLSCKQGSTDAFLYDRFGNQLLKESFLAVFYFKEGKLLVGLNKSKEVVYISEDVLKKDSKGQ